MAVMNKYQMISADQWPAPRIYLMSIFHLPSTHIEKVLTQKTITMTTLICKEDNDLTFGPQTPMRSAGAPQATAQIGHGHYEKAKMEVFQMASLAPTPSQ
jgi:hypothetical protein